MADLEDVIDFNSVTVRHALRTAPAFFQPPPRLLRREPAASLTFAVPIIDSIFSEGALVRRLRPRRPHDTRQPPTPRCAPPC